MKRLDTGVDPIADDEVVSPDQGVEYDLVAQGDGWVVHNASTESSPG